MHDQAYDHEHKPESGENKEKHVLRFLLEHNRQHTVELAGLAAKLDETGKTEAVAHLRRAISDYEAGNEKLHATLHNL